MALLLMVELPPQALVDRPVKYLFTHLHRQVRALGGFYEITCTAWEASRQYEPGRVLLYAVAYQMDYLPLLDSTGVHTDTMAPWNGSDSSHPSQPHRLLRHHDGAVCHLLCGVADCDTGDINIALELLEMLSPPLWANLDYSDNYMTSHMREAPEARLRAFERHVRHQPTLIKCRRPSETSSADAQFHGDVCRDLLATHLRYCLRRVDANDAFTATFMRMYTLRELAYSIVFLRMTTNTHLRAYGMSEVLSGYINGGLINTVLYNTLGFYVDSTHGFPDLELAGHPHAAQIAKRLLIPRTFLMCLGSSLDQDIRQALSLPGIPADAAIDRKETR
jgi:hypothetical protein